MSVFVKFRKSVKIEKIWPKRTGDEGGTVKIGKTEIWPVFPENWCRFENHFWTFD
jgi:hypothetical protein